MQLAAKKEKLLLLMEAVLCANLTKDHQMIRKIVLNQHAGNTKN